jgi:ABC-2 type transport system ATP-binding protein
MSAAVSIQHLQKTYATGVQALKGISFDVQPGELFALLGANGAGKTTLIGILTGLVRKTGGSVNVFGIDIDKEPEKARAMIGVVPQEFNFNIFENVIDIVVDAAGYYGVPRKQAIERAEVLLKDLGLWEKRNTMSRVLSGGMKRRLLIARALVHEPKLLLLDEPSAGVDVELRRGMWDFVTKLNQAGTTIILTTHYMEEAERLCKRVAVLKQGNVAVQGEIAELVRVSGAKNLEEYYLGL